MQTVAEVLMRAEKNTLAELRRLVQRDQGIMGVSRAGKTKTTVTAANVGTPRIRRVCFVLLGQADSQYALPRQ